jgi:hypothetical protein
VRWDQWLLKLTASGERRTSTATSPKNWAAANKGDDDGK